MTQFSFDLPGFPPALGRADFVVSGCNAAAAAAIERWPEWPKPALVLSGPARSGKSHLARMWCARSGARLVAGEALSQAPPDALAAGGAVAVDAAERAPEVALLHLYNCCAEAGASLLVITPDAPAAWPIALPDLASRLRAAPSVAIAAPDDRLLAAVLVKHFGDRQVRVAPEVIGFLLPRMERSFAAAADLAARLDGLSLALGRPITAALARRALADAAGQSSFPSDFGVA